MSTMPVAGPQASRASESSVTLTELTAPAPE